MSKGLLQAHPPDRPAATLGDEHPRAGSTGGPTRGCTEIAGFPERRLRRIKLALDRSPRARDLWGARGCSSMVEQKLPKLTTRVRFPSPAPVAPHVNARKHRDPRIIPPHGGAAIARRADGQAGLAALDRPDQPTSPPRPALLAPVPSAIPVGAVHALTAPDLARVFAPWRRRSVPRTVIAADIACGRPRLAMVPLGVAGSVLPVDPMRPVGTWMHVARPVTHPGAGVVDDRAAGVVPAIRAAVIRAVAVIIRAVAVIVGVADAAGNSHGDQADQG